MRKMATLLTHNNKPIVSYDNVSYEESVYVPDEYGWNYFVPVDGVHYSSYVSPGGSIGINVGPSIEMYNFMLHPGWGLAVGWYDTSVNKFPYNAFGDPGVDFAFTPGNGGYPFGNQWGRYWGIVNPAHYTWQSVGNLGPKTLAEWTTLQSQMDNTTKRNLTGTRLYS